MNIITMGIKSVRESVRDLARTHLMFLTTISSARSFVRLCRGKLSHRQSTGENRQDYAQPGRQVQEAVEHQTSQGCRGGNA